MEGFLGGLTGAIGDVFGGLMNTSSAQAINSANLAQQMFLARNSVSMRVADARRAGINPLAALGVSSPGFVGATPTDPGAGVAAAGQDIARALSAQKDKEEKLDDLQKAEIQSRIDSNEAQTAYIRSKTVRALASPGSPGAVSVSSGVPLPTPDPRYEPEIKPLLQRFIGTNGITVLPSRSVTESSFSALPSVPAIPSIANEVGSGNYGSTDITNVWRPDINRSISPSDQVYTPF